MCYSSRLRNPQIVVKVTATEIHELAVTDNICGIPYQGIDFLGAAIGQCSWLRNQQLLTSDSRREFESADTVNSCCIPYLYKT